MKVLIVAKKLERVVTNDTIELTQELTELDATSVAEQLVTPTGGDSYYNYAITKTDSTTVYYRMDNYLVTIRGH